MCQVTTTTPRKRIAVVGGGISGLACAWLLQKQAERNANGAAIDVVLFEESDIAGGHAMTVDVELQQTTTGTRVPVAVDVGFQVFNLTTYPHLVGFFEELGVTSRPSDMSFGCSVPLYASDADTNSRTDQFDIFEWSSTRNLKTIFPEYSKLLDARRYDLLKDVLRFQKEAPVFLEEVERGQHMEMTVAGYLTAYKYSQTFRDVYMLPMIAAIWSMPKADSMAMPMRTLIRFMVNHHLHKIKNRPKWRTVVDRSRQYVTRAVQQLKDVRLNAPVASVVRTQDGRVQVELLNGETELFDDVVLATHTDISLKLLGESATPQEKELLAKIKYQPNKCVLHTDKSIMPTNRNLWASWNVKEFSRTKEEAAVEAVSPVCCSYWVNLLQNLDEGVEDVFVTLNPPHALANTLMEFELSHPALNKEAVEAQEQLHTIQGKRHVYFAGAWTRYGFHEDGILSAVNVAELLGEAYKTESPKLLLSTQLPWTPRAPNSVPPSLLAHLCLSLFDKYAGSSVTIGCLRLLLPDGSEREYKSDTTAATSASDKHAIVSKSLHEYHGVDLKHVTIVLTIHDLNMFPRIVFGHSSIAMAEAYMDHLFDLSLEDMATRQRVELPQYDPSNREKVDDRLGIFLYWCALNLNKIESNRNLLGGPAQWVGRQIKSFYHWQRQFNTIAQAKKHILMHYDLGNDLYELFLDKSMTYSSGMMPLDARSYCGEPQTLEQISLNLEQEEELKIEHAFLAADIQDGHRVLEIGCGWGSMAIYACKHANCHWTALTLSKEQKAMMEDRVREAGLEDRIEVLLTDFRELVELASYKASFDRVVSLEMIEALGDGNLPGYFADINRFLKPTTGRVLIQAITIPDDRYEQYCKNTDFIKEFIFPGGHLPSRARIYWAIQEGNERVRKSSSPTKKTDLCITEEVEFGKAYASTLRAWRLRMLRNRTAILALEKHDASGEKLYDARFMRMFEWYFAYCEVGFQQGLIHVVQLVIDNKPSASMSVNDSILPATLRLNRSEKIRTKPFTLFESQILTGRVFHGRHDGYKNAFQYDTVMALLNLDDLYLSELFKSHWYMSLNSSNLLAFHRADHFGDPKRTLKSCVLQLVQDECGVDAAALESQVGTVFLLTTIRCMGYCFNPISIYYCMSYEDPSVCLYVVLEVTNTPWMEKHCYVLRATGGDSDGMIDARFVKEMHVSPFFKMDCEYRIRLNHPGSLMQDPSKELRVLLELHERQAKPSADVNEPEPEEKPTPLGKKLFTASLHLTPEPLATKSTTKTITMDMATTANKTTLHEFFVVCNMAIMAWQAQLYIHWHALKLAVNGQPLIRSKHPAYRGKWRAAMLYSGDLVKHLFIFAVALVGLGVIKALKYGTEKPLVGASGAAAVALVTMLLL